MTKYYNFTFTYYFEKITVSKAVTDRMECRPSHKAGYAARYFNQFLREHTGRMTTAVTAAKVQEVTKKDTVTKQQTLDAMEASRKRYIV